MTYPACEKKTAMAVALSRELARRAASTTPRAAWSGSAAVPKLRASLLINERTPRYLP